jgi:hypothetical protein
MKPLFEVRSFARFLSLLLLALAIPNPTSSQPLAPSSPELPPEARERLPRATQGTLLPPWQCDGMLALARASSTSVLESPATSARAVLPTGALDATDGLWQQLSPTGTPPSARWGPGAIYDPVRRRMVMFGGFDESVGGSLPPMNDVWTLSLSQPEVWAQLSPAAPVPWQRAWHSAIYDPVRDRMIVYGGHGQYPGGLSGYFDDVWALTLSGTPTWSDIDPSSGPWPERCRHAAIYDPVRDRMVMFGGADGSVNGWVYFNDVWVLPLASGGRWTQLTPSGTAPGRRCDHTAIYDPVGDRMIVYGGYDGSTHFSDVWALSLAGTPAWTQLTPTGTPPPSSDQATAIYDAPRDRMVVLSEGSHPDVRALLLAGTPAWTQLTSTGTPPPQGLASATIYDAAAGRMVAFGDGVRNGTWALWWGMPAPAGVIPVCSTPGTQAMVRSAPDGAGGAILAWADNRPGAPGIYVQRLSSSGVPLWTTDGLRIYSPPLGVVGVDRLPDAETNVAIVADGAGGAIVAWKDTVGPGNTDILTQRVSSTGARLWSSAGVPVCRAAGRQFYPKLVADGTGGAIVAWQDLRGGPYRVYAQHVNASGSCMWTTDGVLASNAAEDIQQPEWTSLGLNLTADGLGGAILTWSSTRGIVAQRLDSGGAMLWTSSGIVVRSFDRAQTSPQIVPDGVHGAFIAWNDYWDYGAGVYAQRVNASGTKFWAPNGLQVVDDLGDAWQVRIASDAQGGCILLWQDTRPDYCGPCNGGLIYAQRINSGGAALWAAGGVLVSDGTRGLGAVNTRINSEVVPDGSGGVIFSYMLNVAGGSSGPYDIYAQGVTPQGTRARASDVALCTDPGNQQYPVIVQGGAGAIIAWEDGRSGDWNVYGNVVDVTAPRRPYVLSASYGFSGWQLAWEANPDADLDHYALYRGTTPDFPVSPETRIATLTATSYLDAAGTPQSLYKITAVDVNGNESAPTCFMDAMPTPVLVSLVSASAADGQVRIEWALATLANVTLYRSVPGSAWQSLGEVAPDGTGRLVYSDCSVSAGQRYGYRVGITDEGAETSAGEVWVDVPGAAMLALECTRPNPAVGREAMVSFSLPGAAPTHLELLDVSGRLVSRREVGSLGPGSHALRLTEGTPLAPGIYLLRLSTGRQVLTKRVAVIR